MSESLSASPPIYRRDQLDWPEKKQLHSLDSVAQLMIIAATAVEGLCDGGDNNGGDEDVDNDDSVRQRRRRRCWRHRDDGVQYRVP